MTKVLIGLPVYRREWILPTWFEMIEKQTIGLDNLGFLFMLGPNDQATLDVILQWQSNHPGIYVDYGIDFDNAHMAHPDEARDWYDYKYITMVNLRNQLLEEATKLKEYDIYFSLDSDMLLDDPNTIETLANLMDKHEVVSPLSYMKPYDTSYPSVMSWFDKPGGKAVRDPRGYPLGRLFEADIVMAAVMMRREVFETVRYQFHAQGEDLGFAHALYEANYRSHCASHIYVPHIMIKSQFDKYKKIGDPRKQTY